MTLSQVHVYFFLTGCHWISSYTKVTPYWSPSIQSILLWQSGASEWPFLRSVQEWITPLEILTVVPASSPLGCGNVVVFVKDNKPSELAHSFLKRKSVLVSVSVFVSLSTVFHAINSPDNFPLPHSVPLVFFLRYWFFQLYISFWKSPSALIQLFVLDRAQSTN